MVKVSEAIARCPAPLSFALLASVRHPERSEGSDAGGEILRLAALAQDDGVLWLIDDKALCLEEARGSVP
ncbi:MAG: hypothetical protein ACJAQ6_001845 [Arenicella sp.]